MCVHFSAGNSLGNNEKNNPGSQQQQEKEEDGGYFFPGPWENMFFRSTQKKMEVILLQDIFSFSPPTIQPVNKWQTYITLLIFRTKKTITYIEKYP